MPIILAIEPDRRQAAHLDGVVRQKVMAELILAETTESALDAIGDRVPDMVLVPALLSPQDDAALAAALRVIAAAAHVRTLMIPVLANGAKRTKPGGILAKWRRGRPASPSPDGCDPSVFADQINAYLREAAAERAAQKPDFNDAEIEAVPIDSSQPIAIAAPEAIEPMPDGLAFAASEPCVFVAPDPLAALDPVPFATPEAIVSAVAAQTGPSVDEGIDVPAALPMEPSTPIVAIEPTEVAAWAECDSLAESEPRADGTIDRPLDIDWLEELGGLFGEPRKVEAFAGTPADARTTSSAFDVPATETFGLLQVGLEQAPPAPHAAAPLGEPVLEAPAIEARSAQEDRVELSATEAIEPMPDALAFEAPEPCAFVAPEPSTFSALDAMLFAVPEPITSAEPEPIPLGALDPVPSATPGPFATPEAIVFAVAAQTEPSVVEGIEAPAAWTIEPSAPIGAIEPTEVAALAGCDSVAESGPPAESTIDGQFDSDWSEELDGRCGEPCEEAFAGAPADASTMSPAFDVPAPGTFGLPRVGVEQAPPAPYAVAAREEPVVEAPAVDARFAEEDRAGLSATTPLRDVHARQDEEPIAARAQAEIVQAAALPAEPPPQAQVGAPARKVDHPEWLALVASLRQDIERLHRKPASLPSRPIAARPVAGGDGNGSRRIRKQKPFAKKSKPLQDEWGLFDPEQCGFSALLAKLEEITAPPEETEARG